MIFMQTLKISTVFSRSFYQLIFVAVHFHQNTPSSSFVPLLTVPIGYNAVHTHDGNEKMVLFPNRYAHFYLPFLYFQFYFILRFIFLSPIMNSLPPIFISIISFITHYINSLCSSCLSCLSNNNYKQSNLFI